MFLPSYFIHSGIVGGTGLLIFFALLNYLSCLSLVYSARHFKLHSYYRIGEKIFPKFEIVFIIFYLLILFGNIIIYQQFSIDIINLALSSIFGLKSSLYQSIGVTLFTHAIILPFLVKENLSLMRILSFICTFSFFFAVLILVLAFFLPFLFGIQIQSLDTSKFHYFSLKGFLSTFSFYMLGYVQQLIVIETDQELRPRTWKNSNSVLVLSTL